MNGRTAAQELPRFETGPAADRTRSGPKTFALHLAEMLLAMTLGVVLVQHVVMIPAMVGVMLWRYEHYSH